MCIHKQYVYEVRELLFHHRIALNKNKCIIRKTQATFLGHTVTSTGIRPLAEKITTLQHLSKSADYQQLGSFLGTVNLYHNHLLAMAVVQTPPTDAPVACDASGWQPVKWTPETDKTFCDPQVNLSRAVPLAHLVSPTHLAIVFSVSQWQCHKQVDQYRLPKHMCV
ncbi:uncharacterized protein LOC126267849 [Schistocerca gregaria]|uniref:uncharacterized protein LOC126267849 n=1 Tax=Schistocerca gregaria TaxID=7010 RepID=UPI00211E6DA2|nr:uncharacterized protein LOC126267849 [Schistocerca gregaria]